MNKQKFIFLSSLFLLFIPMFFVSAGTISGTYKYAWSNNVGYINLGNVIVDNGSLSGYAWSENTGWINMSPVQGGVSNDGNGNLSGSAWGEGLGWIDFGNVNISTTTGKFSGTATGDEIGILTFDCNHCDVRTDWTPNVVPPPPTPTPTPSQNNSISSRVRTIFSEGATSSPSLVENVDAQNKQLIILPYQSGTLIQDTEVGKVILEIPDFNIAEETIFTIDLESLKNIDLNLVSLNMDIVNGVFYKIVAKDQNGNPIHFFPKPITITLPIPKNLLNTQNLAVYWLDEVEKKWNIIPDAVFSGDKVTFKINHLTKFGIFSSQTKDFPTQISTSTSSPSVIEKNENKITDYRDLLQIPLFLLIAFLLLFVLKNKKWSVHRDSK